MRISYPKQKIALTVGYLAAVALWWRLGWPCVSVWLLGIPCPGCGMTRAWLALLQGDLAAAFMYHPMFWSVPLLYAYFLLDGGLLRRRWADAALLIAVAVGFVLQWAVKLAA